MSTLFVRSVVLTLMVLVLMPVAPTLASASVSSVPEGYLVSHDDDEDEDDDRTNYRVRYSSSLRNKIERLDDDAVEKLPIPIAIGVDRSDLWPNFGDPRDGGAREHQGLDIMAPKGAFVVSPTDAVVLRTGKGTTEGTYVYTMGPGGETFAYFHLDKIATGIKEGVELDAGDLIGYVGNTGNASGGAPHLHFEVRDGRTPTDPYPRLTGTFTLQERINSLTDILNALKKAR